MIINFRKIVFSILILFVLIIGSNTVCAETIDSDVAINSDYNDSDYAFDCQKWTYYKH